MTQPWLSLDKATPDGTVSELRFKDALGFYETDGEYFLHFDGYWYRIDPPTRLNTEIIYSWRPKMQEME